MPSCFFFDVTGGDEHPLLVIYILIGRTKRKKVFTDPLKTQRKREKIKPSKQINQICLSIQLNTLYVLASHDAKAM